VVDERQEFSSPLHFASLNQVTYGGMTMRRSLTVIFLLVIFLLWNTPTVTAQFQEAGIEKLRVAVDAPDLTLKELGGGKISLKELRGKIILLNFFATW
jgi:cytochrome oxidase Cu insertion factor (SCO1/SenC/PrrC family)